MKASVYLQCKWENIVFANYEVDPGLLAKYLPPHTQLDTYNGTHYISIVAQQFKNTRIKGVIVPFLRDFEEISLRFYVRHKENDEWKRGVVFIKEIVPKKLIARVASKIFGKNYEPSDTRHLLSFPEPEKLSIEYMWKDEGLLNWMAVSAKGLAKYPPKGSEEEFICSPYYGYSTGANGSASEYIVEHPQWRMHQVLHFDIRCAFDKVFGPDFAFLARAKPKSVFLAYGSEIKLSGKRKVKEKKTV